MSLEHRCLQAALIVGQVLRAIWHRVLHSRIEAAGFESLSVGKIQQSVPIELILDSGRGRCCVEFYAGNLNPGGEGIASRIRRSQINPIKLLVGFALNAVTHTRCQRQLRRQVVPTLREDRFGLSRKMRSQRNKIDDVLRWISDPIKGA